MSSMTGIPQGSTSPSPRPRTRYGNSDSSLDSMQKKSGDDNHTTPPADKYDKNKNIDSLQPPQQPYLQDSHIQQSHGSLPLNADTSDGNFDISMIKVPSPTNGIFVTVTFYNFLHTHTVRIPSDLRELHSDVFKHAVWLVQLSNNASGRRENLKRISNAFNIHLPVDQMDPADWIYWQRHTDKGKRMWLRAELSDEFPYFPLSIVPSEPGTMRFEIIISSKNGPVPPDRFDDVMRCASKGWSHVWHALKRRKAAKVWSALVEREYVEVDGVKTLKLAHDQPHIEAPDWSDKSVEPELHVQKHYQVPPIGPRF